MPAKKRYKTKYAGVYYIHGTTAKGEQYEKIYYIRYRKGGKSIEEKAGRQYQDDMTPARASGIRSDRIDGKQLSNREKREIASKYNKRWTIERLWEEYRLHLSDGGSRTDRSRWRLHLQYRYGQKEPKDLHQLEIDRMRINLLKKRSPQTVKHCLTLLKRIINFGVNRGLCQPLKFKINMPLVDNIKTEDLSPKQMRSLIKVLQTTPYQTASVMMKIALYTGLRRGEIFKLKWDHVDFNRGFIHIVKPKGKKNQKVPLNSDARKLFKSIAHSKSRYIFPARGGGPRKSIAKDVREIREVAGLPKDFRPFHGLRHVYATMLASSGQVDLYTLQKLLTHKSPEMTQRYAHLRDDALKRASDLTGDIIDQTVGQKKMVIGSKK